MQLDTFLNMVNKTREMYKQELSSSAEDRLKKRLVLNKVAEEEGLTVEEEELEEEIERLIEAMGEQAESMRAVINTPGGKESVSQDLVMSKAQQRVVEIAKGEIPTAEEEVGTEAEVAEEAEEGAAEAAVAEAAVAEAAVAEAAVAEAAAVEAAVVEDEAEAEAESEGIDQEPAPEEEPEPEAES
jgi:hypothetical protein